MKTYFISGRIKETETSSTNFLNVSDSDLIVNGTEDVLSFQQKNLHIPVLQQQSAFNLHNISFRKVCFSIIICVITLFFYRN